MCWTEEDDLQAWAECSRAEAEAVLATEQERADLRDAAAIELALSFGMPPARLVLWLLDAVVALFKRVRR